MSMRPTPKVALGALDRVATAEDIQRLLQKLPASTSSPTRPPSSPFSRTR
jgi:hypothetical protein